MASTPSDAPDPVHDICARYVADYAALDPNEATLMGVEGHDDRLTDYSADGHQARADLARRALREIAAVTPSSESAAVAKEVFTERVGLGVELHDAGEQLGYLNVIHSPAQELRQAFDLMPVDTATDWQAVAARLAAMPTAVAQVRDGYTASAAAGKIAALRQVTKVAEQCDVAAGVGVPESFFARLVTGADGVDGVDDALRDALRSGAEQAAQSFAELADFLRGELAPKAPERDAVGPDVYQLWSRYFLGATVDLAEAYEWGWQEFSRLEQEMTEVAGRIKPGASLAEAAAVLDADERYRVHGQDELQSWMQSLSDRALAELRDTHFTIPDELMALECRIAPPGGVIGAYYTAPSDGFARPGRMWWSVPADRAEFSTWREVSTVYHEGVPGHHLQLATAVRQADSLTRFQRLMCFVSGHGEGWALYAERLMRELGYLADDGDLLGMLDAHLFRAARVIVDIGMHLELEIPRGAGFHDGERWTPELGLEFMLQRTITDPHHVRDEIDRYLGWPGQAPSYKLGERLWLSARADAQRRHGDRFDIKEFHRQALELGPMGLDTLRTRLALL